MPAGSSWERGRRREREERKVGGSWHGYQVFPSRDMVGGGRRGAVEKKEENDTEKRK